MAKFIKDVKKTITDAKGSLEEEMKIADLKEEALAYKKQLTDATDELKGFKNISFDDFDDDVSYDEEVSKESPQKLASQNKPKDPSPETSETETETEAVVATQVEPKNDTVTLKKKPKNTPKIVKKMIHQIVKVIHNV